MTQSHPLFGGAISLLLPNGYVDASQLRQVPDNQEVFVSSTDNSSVIVELLEEEMDQQDAPLFHLLEMVESATDLTLVARVSLPITQNMNLQPEASIHIIHARQNAAKFNETKTTRVHTFLAVVRIPRVSTDLLVSMHRPVEADTREADNTESLSQFSAFINTLRVNDYSLFQ